MAAHLEQATEASGSSEQEQVKKALQTNGKEARLMLNENGDNNGNLFNNQTIIISMINQQQNVISQQASQVSAVSTIAATAATTTTTTTTMQHSNQANPGPWLTAAQTTAQGVRQRMSIASDQLGHSLRQLYASASSVTDLPPSYHNIPGVVPYFHGRSSGPPPSYDDVVNPYAPPPTYQSLFGQMREARKTSRGFLDLLRRLLIILISTLGCTILIAFMILIPFTMIIVGAIYLDDCRIEHIPAFLLVGGFVWASKNIIHCYAQCQPASTSLEIPMDSGDLYTSSPQIDLQNNNLTDTPTSNRNLEQGGFEQQQQQHQRRLRSASICESLLNCVLFGWFIAGCVIVFRNFEPDFEDPTSVKYCNKTVYMYTIGVIGSALAIFIFFISCICFLMITSAVASRQEEDDLE